MNARSASVSSSHPAATSGTSDVTRKAALRKAMTRAGPFLRTAAGERRLSPSLDKATARLLRELEEVSLPLSPPHRCASQSAIG